MKPEALIDSARKTIKSFDRWCHKTFEFPPEYHSLTSLRQVFADGFAVPQILKIDPSLKEEALPAYVSTMMAEKCDYPFYLVSPNILKALLKTTPPKYWDRNEVKLGFPCIHFVLPKGVLKGDDGEDVAVMSISIVSPGDLLNLGIGLQSHSKEDRLLCTATSVTSQTNWYAFIPIEDGVIDLESKIETHKSKWDIGEDPAKVTVFTQGQLIPLLLQLVMLFHLRPENVEEASFIKRVKGKHGQREFWTPRFLGRRYALQSEVTGTHASPETHWRIGHYREQHYGKGNVSIKTIWIDPVMVNAPR